MPVGLNIPAHDRRILQLLALKLQKKKQTILKAETMQRRWVLEKQQESQVKSRIDSAVIRLSSSKEGLCQIFVKLFN